MHELALVKLHVSAENREHVKDLGHEDQMSNHGRIRMRMLRQPSVSQLVEVGLGEELLGLRELLFNGNQGAGFLHRAFSKQNAVGQLSRRLSAGRIRGKIQHLTCPAAQGPLLHHPLALAHVEANPQHRAHFNVHLNLVLAPNHERHAALIWRVRSLALPLNGPVTASPRARIQPIIPEGSRLKLRLG